MEFPDYRSSTANESLRSTAIGIITSAVLAVVKAAGGIFGNSYALIADAIESTTDVFTSCLLWLGLKWAAKPPDKDHPYGHGKLEALIAICIALVLCGAAVLIAIESIHNMRTPHAVPKAFTLIILIVVIVTKELLYRYVLNTGKKIKSGAVKADAIHHRSDAITSAAAFIGISIGIIGGQGYEIADDCAALFASLVIFFNAYHIARPAVGELLDEELEPQLNKKVMALAAEVPRVLHVQKCHTRKMGVMSHADLHIWVDKNLSVVEGHTIAHAVKDHIQKTLPQVADVMIHVEPAENSY
jgi:cation diffusion facilitator family transporter